MTTHTETSREVLNASRVLGKNLAALRTKTSGIKQISVRVDESEGSWFKTKKGPPKVSKRLIITIEADSQEHAEEHAAELEAQGCTCTSSGETSVTCECDAA